MALCGCMPPFIRYAVVGNGSSGPMAAKEGRKHSTGTAKRLRVAVMVSVKRKRWKIKAGAESESSLKRVWALFSSHPNPAVAKDCIASKRFWPLLSLLRYAAK